MKLYVAILSSGWWRRELGGILIPRMMSMNNIKVGIENPVKTWSQPIVSNRNGIRKRFLGSDYEFLLMIDNDTVPIDNPAELVFANEDIIGCPALTRLKNGNVCWNVYKAVGDSYHPLDIDSIKNPTDLMDVDAHGFGCILIKRCVLENIIFEDVFDDNGERIRGEDIEFCRKAKVKGFSVYTTPKRQCEHFKNTGIMGLRASILEKDNAATKATIG